jgi:ubiquinone/menaquinone biosynthesis C-methylase UbiE
MIPGMQQSRVAEQLQAGGEALASGDANHARTQRLYDGMAPVYAGAMRLLPVWRRYTEAAWPWLWTLPASSAVLEIGPGPGVLLAQLARRFRLAAGLDLSTGMLQQAQRRLGQAGQPALLVQGDAARLPLAAASFDAVVLTFAFSAFPDGLGAMREMRRVLRPGGLAILVDAGLPSDGNCIGVALARAWTLFGDFMRDEASLMAQAGLVVIERREFGAFDGIRLVVGRAGQD